MNRTIRNLVIAVPLATVGLTMVNTVAATAGPNGPIVIGQPENDDPFPHPKPKPKFDNDLPLKDAPKPKKPAPKPQPKAPKPAFQPKAQVVVAPKAEKKVVKAVETISAHGSADSIDRADILFVAGPAETVLVADNNDGGMDLTWLLVGGGIVTASGIAFAARKRSNA